jgi:hypothetical protein
MNLYIVEYHHRHGVEIALVLSEEIPDAIAVAEALEFDYEPEREDEFIDISSAGPAMNMTTKKYVDIERIIKSVWLGKQQKLKTSRKVPVPGTRGSNIQKAPKLVYHPEYEQ